MYDELGIGRDLIGPHCAMAYPLRAPLGMTGASVLGHAMLGARAWRYGTGWSERDAHCGAVVRARDLASSLAEAQTAARSQRLQRLAVRAVVAAAAADRRAMDAAVLDNDFDAVLALAGRGVSLGMPCACGHTPLSMAALRGWVRVSDGGGGVPRGARVTAVMLLLTRAGAPPVDDEAPLGLTPLAAAASQGRAGIVQELLDHGADPNRATSRDGRPPLLHAATAGKWRAARVLLDRGADPLARGADGVDAYHAALAAGSAVVAGVVSAAARCATLTAVAVRGLADELVMCGWGCGARVAASVRGVHEDVCPKRVRARVPRVRWGAVGLMPNSVSLIGASVR